MASDNLINVIAGLVKRDGRIAKEADQKVKAKLKAEKEKKDGEEEDDEDEDPVGDPTPAGKDTATEPEEDEQEPEEKPKEGEGGEEPDNKITGPDPALVAQVAAIIKKELKDEDQAKKDQEVKLSGKKEKINTKPTMKQEGKMNFREAIRASLTGSPMAEGYESHVLEILNDEGIDGPLGYEPFFEDGKLLVMKGQEGRAKKALKNSGEIRKLPKIVGEEKVVDEKVEIDDGKLTDEESELQKKYKEFYDKMLAKFGVKSPGEMDDDKKKEFFNAIEKGWKEGEGPVEENLEDFEEFLVNMVAVDELKMSTADKKKAALYRRSPAGKKAIKKYLKKSSRPGYKPDKQLAKAMKKSAKKPGIRSSFEPEGEEQIEESREPVSVDGRRKGFKEAIRRLTYEKLRKLHDKAKSEEVRRSVERWSSETLEESKKKIEIDEGYEKEVILSLRDKGIDSGFYKGKLYVAKRDVKKATEILKKDSDISKLPTIIGEEVEIDEAKSGTGYELYHKDFSSAMQHAYDHAKKKGFVVDPKEIDDKVATGPKKPSSGKTNRYILGTDKKKNVHVQVTNLDNKRYELNMYIEEVEPVDEGKGIGNFNTDPKKIKKEYEDNEDINHHTENYLLLAVHFGTNTQVKKVKEIMKRNEKQGSTSQKDNDWMYKNIMPYYDKIRNEEVELGETVELQIVMALDDVDIVATEITDKEVTVKKKEVKKAEAALKKSFKGKKVPKVIGEKFTISAFDKIKGIRNRLNEGIDRVAAVELKTYIENDSDLYRQQIVPIIKNVQRKMKSGKYDHTKAPKLWMYLIDNGAKKYVKEFGGNVKDMFPKDLRMSVANEFANEYRAEIEIQGGEMV